MRALPLPSRALALQHLTDGLAVYVYDGEPHGYAVTEIELQAVITLYDSYDAAGGAPNDSFKGLHLDAALRTAIQKAYDFTQLDRRLASIRTDLMRNIERCPICGISAPRVLDHYLPKGTYLPLAIYVRNLVPLCGDCNQYKSNSMSAAPAEQFIHPYFELLPDTRFLRAQVAIDNGALIAEFGLDPNVVIPDLLAARLGYQLTRLRLNQRYAQEINVYLASQITGLGMCFNARGVDGVRDYLTRQAAVEFARFHPNHWRPVLLTALANDENFCASGFQSVLPMAAAGIDLEPHED